MKYRFLGTLTDILGDPPLRLNRYGQQFEISDDQVADIKHGKGISAIPEDEFLAIFPEGKVDPRAPDFAEKKERALDLLRSARQESARQQEEVKQPNG